MNNEDLLDYFETHSRTERALFHTDMIDRLLDLAGEPLSDWRPPPRQSGFMAAHSDVVDPLVKKARARMDIDSARYALIAGFVPDGAAREAAIHQSLAALARRAYQENERMRLDLDGFRENGRLLRTLITLVRGIPSVVALLEHLEKTGGSIPTADFGSVCATVESRAETLLKTINGTYPSRELTREGLSEEFVGP